MGLLSPWCPPFTNVQATASGIYEHHDTGTAGGRLHRCSMMPHQESAPSIYVYIWFPSVLRVANGLNLLTATPRLSGGEERRVSERKVSEAKA